MWFRHAGIADDNGRFYQPPRYTPPQVHNTSSAAATHPAHTSSPSHAPAPSHTDTVSISDAAREKLAQHLTMEDRQLLNKTYVAVPGETEHYGNHVTMTAGLGYAHVDASAHVGGSGLDVSGNAQAAVVKMDAQANSKHVSGGVGVDVGNVEAHGKLEVNTRGFNAGGSAEADVADAHVSGKLDFTIPFINKTVEIDASAKALFGVGASGHAALNGNDGFHAGLGFGVALGPGYQWSVDVGVK